MNNIATSIEQSKKLLELGIDPSTASMIWVSLGKNCKWILNLAPYKDDEKDNFWAYRPAWTLVDLIKLLPCEVIEGGRHYYLDISKFSVRYGIERVFYISDFYLNIAEFMGKKTLIDLVVEAIIILKERGKI